MLEKDGQATHGTRTGPSHLTPLTWDQNGFSYFMSFYLIQHLSKKSEILYTFSNICQVFIFHWRFNNLEGFNKVTLDYWSSGKADTRPGEVAVTWSCSYGH